MDVIETERLVLRRPRVEDAPAIFARYASDPEVTRFMAWPTHRSLDDTRAFLQVCDALWAQWPTAGPLLVFARDGVTLLGGAGVVPNSETGAQIGYVFARDAWGRGYATEALTANVEAVRHTALRRLEAGVHVHQPSCHVLEKPALCAGIVLAGRPTFPTSRQPRIATRRSTLWPLDFDSSDATCPRTDPRDGAARRHPVLHDLSLRIQGDTPPSSVPTAPARPR